MGSSDRFRQGISWLWGPQSNLLFFVIHNKRNVIDTFHRSKLIISERRRKARREASRRSTQRAFCHIHMEKQNIITRDILILEICFIEKKLFFFDVEPISVMDLLGSLSSHLSNLLQDTSLKFSHNKVTGLKIVVSNFHRYFLISSEVKAYFA